MLVLSRKESERITIGDRIVITVVRIDPYTVRLGIEAPKSDLILRDELAARRPKRRKKKMFNQGRGISRERQDAIFRFVPA